MLSVVHAFGEKIMQQCSLTPFPGYQLAVRKGFEYRNAIAAYDDIFLLRVVFRYEFQPAGAVRINIPQGLKFIINYGWSWNTIGRLPVGLFCRANNLPDNFCRVWYTKRYIFRNWKKQVIGLLWKGLQCHTLSAGNAPWPWVVRNILNRLWAGISIKKKLSFLSFLPDR